MREEDSKLDLRESFEINNLRECASNMFIDNLQLHGIPEEAPDLRLAGDQQVVTL